MPRGPCNCNQEARFDTGEALQVENVECKSDGENHITFDFLGKDSIKYFNTVKVEPRVFQLVKDFCRGEGRKGTARATSRLPQGLNTLLGFGNEVICISATSKTRS